MTHKQKLLATLVEREKDGIKLNRHDRRLRAKLTRTIKVKIKAPIKKTLAASLPVS